MTKKFLLENITLGSAFIIICSSLKLILYYGFFNIKISDFVGIDEYIALFLDDLMYYLSIFISIFIFNYLNEKSFFQRIDKFFGESRKIDYGNIIISTIIISLQLFILYKKASITEYEYERLLYIQVFLYVFTVLIIGILIMLKTRIKFTYTILILFMIFIALDGLSEAYKVIEKDSKLIYTFELENEILKTGKNIKYLGKTENFIFIHNTVTKTSEIIPTTQILNIKIQLKNGS